MENESFGSRLDEFARQKYGNKHGYKTKFARDLDIDRSAMTRYLQSINPPPKDVIDKLKILGCDIHYLITGIHTSNLIRVQREDPTELKADYIDLQKKNHNLSDDIDKLLRIIEDKDDEIRILTANINMLKELLREKYTQ